MDNTEDGFMVACCCTHSFSLKSEKQQLFMMDGTVRFDWPLLLGWSILRL